MKTDMISPLYQSIADRVTKFLNCLDIGEGQLLAGIDDLRRQLGTPGGGQIDYDRLALPFFCRYFWANFWKAVHCFHEQPPVIARSFIDAGCGSGATTLAYLAWLETHAPKSSWHVEALLIDRSAKQLDLASNLFKELCSEFQSLDVSFKFQRLDLEEWQPEYDIVDLVILGHVLTENRSKVEPLLEKAFLACTEQANIYIIEHIDDGIWHDLDNLISRLTLPISEGIIENRHLELSSKLLAVQKSEVAGRYLAIRVPQPKRIAGLLKLYFHAWEKQSTELLEHLFDSKAQYYTKPYSSPLQGLDQIKTYWIAHVLPQRNIDIRILRVAYEARYAFAEWQAHFMLNKQGIDLKGALILEFNRNIDRVVTLREYYRTLKR
jgi:SAM-dependent methyltransferase